MVIVKRPWRESLYLHERKPKKKLGNYDEELYSSDNRIDYQNSSDVRKVLELVKEIEAYFNRNIKVRPERLNESNIVIMKRSLDYFTKKIDDLYTKASRYYDDYAKEYFRDSRAYKALLNRYEAKEFFGADVIGILKSSVSGGYEKRRQKLYEDLEKEYGRSAKGLMRYGRIKDGYLIVEVRDKYADITVYEKMVEGGETSYGYRKVGYRNPSLSDSDVPDKVISKIKRIMIDEYGIYPSDFPTNSVKYYYTLDRVLEKKFYTGKAHDYATSYIKARYKVGFEVKVYVGDDYSVLGYSISDLPKKDPVYAAKCVILSATEKIKEDLDELSILAKKITTEGYEYKSAGFSSIYSEFEDEYNKKLNEIEVLLKLLE